MALSFVKSAGTKTAATPATSKTTTTVASGSKISFLKRGSAAQAALSAAEAQAELAKQEAGKMWRFWMPDGEDRRITFLDGELDEDGILDVPMYHEHTIRINGNWEHFVCTAEVDESQPCPLCEAGDRPALVGAMTVIDHSEHKVKSGPNAGKVIVNSRKLFIPKRNTIKLLTKIATKRGGLAGCTFDVSRTGDKEASVGNQFDFVEKFESYEDIAAKYGLELEGVAPANYTEEIRYRTPEELIELGVGKSITTSSFGSKKAGSNLSSEL